MNRTADALTTPSETSESKSPANRQEGGDHYSGYPIQPAEFICRNDIPFLEGCVIKRMCRYKKKNGIEDLRKAIHEIQLIALYEYGVKEL